MIIDGSDLDSINTIIINGKRPVIYDGNSKTNIITGTTFKINKNSGAVVSNTFGNIFVDDTLKYKDFDDSNTPLSSVLKSESSSNTTYVTIESPDKILNYSRVGNLVRNNITEIILDDTIEGIMTDSKTSILNVTGSYGTFESCKNITDIYLGRDLKEIGKYAFYSMTSLKNIYYNCKNLNNMDALGSGRSIWSSTRGINLTIGPDVERVSDYIFSRVSTSSSPPNLLTLNFEEGVKEIGSNSFTNQSNIKTLNLPDSLEKIGSSAFAHLSNLNFIKFGKNLKEIDTDAFYSIKDTVTVDISDIKNWVSINFANVFSTPLRKTSATLLINGEETTTLTIPEGVTKINSYSFYKVGSLFNTVNIPSTLTTFEQYAISDLSNAKINFDGSFDSFVNIKKENCLLGRYNLYINGTKISKDLVDPVLSSYCLNGCLGIKSLTLKTKEQTIPMYSFASSGIKTLDISAKDCTILGNAFAGSDLNTVKFTWSVKCKKDAFSDASKIQYFKVPVAAELYNCQFESGTANPLYNGSCKLYVNNIEIKKITNDNTAGSISLYSVTNLPQYTFYNYKFFNEISLGANPTTIGTDAFYGIENTNLKVYTDNLVNWCNHSFANKWANPTACSRNLCLKDYPDTDIIELDFNSSVGVTKINSYAFVGIKSLRKATFYGENKPSFGDNIFEDSDLKTIEFDVGKTVSKLCPNSGLRGAKKLREFYIKSENPISTTSKLFNIFRDYSMGNFLNLNLKNIEIKGNITTTAYPWAYIICHNDTKISNLDYMYITNNLTNATNGYLGIGTKTDNPINIAFIQNTIKEPISDFIYSPLHESINISTIKSCRNYYSATLNNEVISLPNVNDNIIITKPIGGISGVENVYGNWTGKNVDVYIRSLRQLIHNHNANSIDSSSHGTNKKDITDFNIYKYNNIDNNSDSYISPNSSSMGEYVDTFEEKMHKTITGGRVWHGFPTGEFFIYKYNFATDKFETSEPAQPETTIINSWFTYKGTFVGVEEDVENIEETEFYDTEVGFVILYTEGKPSGTSGHYPIVTIFDNIKFDNYIWNGFEFIECKSEFYTTDVDKICNGIYIYGNESYNYNYNDLRHCLIQYNSDLNGFYDDAGNLINNSDIVNYLPENIGFCNSIEVWGNGAPLITKTALAGGPFSYGFNIKIPSSASKFKFLTIPINAIDIDIASNNVGGTIKTTGFGIDNSRFVAPIADNTGSRSFVQYNMFNKNSKLTATSSSAFSYTSGYDFKYVGRNGKTYLKYNIGFECPNDEDGNNASWFYDFKEGNILEHFPIEGISCKINSIYPTYFLACSTSIDPKYNIDVSRPLLFMENSDNSLSAWLPNALTNNRNIYWKFTGSGTIVGLGMAGSIKQNSDFESFLGSSSRKVRSIAFDLGREANVIVPELGKLKNVFAGTVAITDAYQIYDLLSANFENINCENLFIPLSAFSVPYITDIVHGNSSSYSLKELSNNLLLGNIDRLFIYVDSDFTDFHDLVDYYRGGELLDGTTNIKNKISTQALGNLSAIVAKTGSNFARNIYLIDKNLKCYHWESSKADSSYADSSYQTEFTDLFGYYILDPYYAESRNATEFKNIVQTALN